MTKLHLPLSIIVTLILGAHLLILTKLQFTAWPEMLTYPYLKNNGYYLYQDLIHPYPPLLTTILAWVFQIFSYKLSVLKIFTWFTILSSSILIGFLARGITSSKYAFIASMSFYLVSQPFLEGNMMWFDLAIVPYVLLETYSLFQWSKNKSINWLILSGFSLMSAALIKQTAGVILVLAIIFVYLKSKSLRNLLIYCVGPFALGSYLLIQLLRESSLANFLNWLIVYPVTYWGKYPNYVQMSLSLRDMVTLSVLLLPLLLLITRLGKNIFNPFFLFLLGELLISIIIVYPRFSFFHLQLAIALLAVFFGLLSSYYEKNRLFLFGTLVVILFIVTWGFKVPIGFGQEARFYDSEEIKLSQTISKSIERPGLVYMQGVNATQYVFTNTLPPKPWTDNFGWYLEIPGVQKEIIERWKASPLEYVVWQNPRQGNWFDLGVYQPQKIVDYFNTNYNKKQEISPNIYLWQRKD